MTTGSSDCSLFCFHLTCVCDHVRLQVWTLREPFPTLGTFVGFESSVGPVVQLQALQAGEALAALGADVILDVAVSPLVAAQAALQLEAFPTGGTLVRFPVRVRHLVLLQALRVCKHLVACRTRQQLLVLVCIAVEVETLVGHKHFAADVAAVTRLIFVHLEVSVELGLRPKAISTEPAPKGFGSRVGPVVSLPIPLQGKAAIAVGTSIWLFAVVDLLVDHKADHCWVRLPTFPALVGLLSTVDTPVSVQVRHLVEALLTVWAVDHPPASIGLFLKIRVVL